MSEISGDPREKLRELLAEQSRRDQENALSHWFPDETHEWRGQKYWARDLYKKQLEFFQKGSGYRERAMIAANRSGKTLSCGYEAAVHLTGEYKPWWNGRRFERSVNAWVAGKTYDTTRDILQKMLLGKVTYRDGRKTVDGTGMIPGRYLRGCTWRSGVPDSVDTIMVDHASGGSSVLGFKAYAQGRGAFEGTEQDLIWTDEEPPLDVYSEMLVRTMTTNGLVMVSYTPVEGLSDVTLSFMPGGADVGDRR